MTPKQEAFCKAYVETGVGAEAYRRSYNAEKSTSKSCIEKASQLLAQVNIAARVQELRDLVTEDFLWERKDSLGVLAEIAKSKEDAARDRIGAVKELNSMHGYNAPVENRHSFIGADGKPLNVTVSTTYVSVGCKNKG